MVRFFTPAAIWINLSAFHSQPDNVELDQQLALPDALPSPPEKLHKLIEFLENQLKPGQPLENHVLAVIANAYSNNAELFREHVTGTVLKMLGLHPSFDLHSKWSLPFGRKTDPFLNAIDLTFLG